MRSWVRWVIALGMPAVAAGSCTLERHGTAGGSTFDSGGAPPDAAADGASASGGVSMDSAGGVGGVGAQGGVGAAGVGGVGGQAGTNVDAAGGAPADAPPDAPDGVTPLAVNDARLCHGRKGVPPKRVQTWVQSAQKWVPEPVDSPLNGELIWVVNQVAPGAGDEELFAMVTYDGSLTELSVARHAQGVTTVDWSTQLVLGGGADTRGLDVAYESMSGDALVVFSDGTDTPVYRARSGGVWGPVQPVPTNVSTGVVYWVEAEANPISDEVAVAFVDANADLVALIWDGTDWDTTATRLIATAVNPNPVTGIVHNRAFDLAYQANGQLMLAWADEFSNGFWYITRPGAFWSFASPYSTNLSPGIHHFVDLAVERGGNRIAIGLFDLGDAGERVGAATWDGTQWADGAILDLQIRDLNDLGTGDFPGGVAWVGGSATAVLVYPDEMAGRLDWASWREPSGWVLGAPFPVAGKGFTESVQIRSSPSVNEVLAVYSDSGSALYASIFDGVGWRAAGSPVPLDEAVSTIGTMPFAFDFRRP